MSNKIVDLVAARITRKREEDAAIEARRLLDAQIVAMVQKPGSGEGTVSAAAGEYVVKIQYGFKRDVDAESLKVDFGNLSPAAQAVFRWKAELSVSAWKALSDMDKAAVAKFIESKPTTPSVKIEAA